MQATCKSFKDEYPAMQSNGLLPQVLSRSSALLDLDSNSPKVHFLNNSTHQYFLFWLLCHFVTSSCPIINPIGLRVRLPLCQTKGTRCLNLVMLICKLCVFSNQTQKGAPPTTVPFRPGVHDFRKFALREGQKFNFQFMVNFKPVRFFGRDAWLNTWSKCYSNSNTCILHLHRPILGFV